MGLVIIYYSYIINELVQFIIFISVHQFSRRSLRDLLDLSLQRDYKLNLCQYCIMFESTRSAHAAQKSLRICVIRF